MAKVTILCGRIASGKTTIAKQICEAEKGIILSIDDVMLKLYDGCLGQEKHAETMQKISEYFYTLVPSLLACDVNVVFDYGYWSRKERDVIRSHFKQANIPYEMCFICVEDEIRNKRLSMRNDGLRAQEKRVYIIEDELLETLDARFEEPQEDEEITIVYNNEDRKG